MAYFASVKDLPIYEDCDFSSHVSNTLVKDDLFEIKSKIGVWYHIKTISTNMSGWIYTYDNDNGILIVEDYKMGYLGIRKNDIITIDSDAAFVKDYYGNTLTTKNGYDPILFRVEDVVVNPVRIHIKKGVHDFWFTPDQITKQERFSNNGIMAAAEEQPPTENNPTPGDNIFAYLNPMHWVDVVKKVWNEYNNQEVTSEFENFKVNSIRTVFGMPYQFLDVADQRIDTDVGSSYESFGSKYAERIVARMPLLIMVPGRPEFMGRYSKKDRSSALSTILGGDNDVSDTVKTQLDSAMNKNGAYYSFWPDWAAYYRYVNPMCRIAAQIMKISDREIPDGKGGSSTLANYHWENNAASITSKLNYKGGCAFYLNADPEASDTFSNETTKSALADKINEVSGKVRELKFILGSMGTDNKGVSKAASTTAGAAAGVAGDATQMVTPNVIGSILNGMGEVLEGSKMRFPELWSDSSISRDYSINIKLISPDCDPLSLYLNIIVPLIHLMGFVMPHATKSPNTYNAPFLVRAFYKGIFNIDMGIITSMNISKGNVGRWAYSGIPSEVNVSITIKDLYELLSITANDNDKMNTSVDFLSNASLLDYIANWCGVNINEPDIIRTLLMYKIIIAGKAIDLIPNVENSVTQWVYNKLFNLMDYHR